MSCKGTSVRFWAECGTEGLKATEPTLSTRMHRKKSGSTLGDSWLHHLRRTLAEGPIPGKTTANLPKSSYDNFLGRFVICFLGGGSTYPVYKQSQDGPLGLEDP